MDISKESWCMEEMGEKEEWREVTEGETGNARESVSETEGLYQLAEGELPCVAE